MANDLNQCNFIGRLGKDPDVRYMPSGGAVANFSIAVGSQWKDKQSGEKQERTEWVRCSAFGRLAEVIGEYLRKGSQVFVSGEWRTDKWQDNNGNDRYTTKVNVRQLQMLGSRGDGNQSGGQSQQSSASGAGGHSDFDDDIPFAPRHWLDG